MKRPSSSTYLHTLESIERVDRSEMKEVAPVRIYISLNSGEKGRLQIIVISNLGDQKNMKAGR
jgi:hypothetical protein